jgi:hypothetical protein
VICGYVSIALVLAIALLFVVFLGLSKR